jgi:hypothetical protein
LGVRIPPGVLFHFLFSYRPQALILIHDSGNWFRFFLSVAIPAEGHFSLRLLMFHHPPRTRVGVFFRILHILRAHLLTHHAGILSAGRF